MATEEEIANLEMLKKKCFGKQQHKSQTAAEYALQSVKNDKRKAFLEIYRCSVCSYLHIGHRERKNKRKFKMNTPEIIENLKPNEVFVFGSNQFAQHAGGAAKVAIEKFGAINNVAPSGLCGQSYGIITTSFNNQPITLDFIEVQIINLYLFAKTRPELTFYVTKIGTGIAGFSLGDIAGLFIKNGAIKPKNIILPIEFI